LGLYLLYMKQIETYQEAVEYLYSNLPMFQRVGAVAYKKDLSNTIALCEVLGNPHKKFKSVHVAGTNGKGSTSHMLASILQEAGYKTGLYTSPHLKDYTERIRINGTPIESAFVVEFLNKIIPTIESISPSFFEITVALAFDYFASQHVDIAIIEVGLGGRLDSTNVITPELSVITNIGWDHMDLLGDTLEKIAGEKAGIIKLNVPVVVSERQAELVDVFQLKAEKEETTLCFAEEFYTVKLKGESAFQGFTAFWNKEYFLDIDEFPLGGRYQQKNIAGVLMSVEVLNEQGFVVPVEAIKLGLQQVVKNTHLKGRWQKIGDQPLIICDTGHNKEGLMQVVAQLATLSYATLHMVIGMVKEKDANAIFKLLPKDAIYYFCQAKIPRAEAAKHLAEKASAFGLKGKVIEDVNEALAEAKRNAAKGDVIFVGGSTFVVAEIKEL
jgi:dihydrofolate synthase / folylpolyglutamate synthase